MLFNLQPEAFSRSTKMDDLECTYFVVTPATQNTKSKRIDSWGNCNRTDDIRMVQVYIAFWD